MAKIIDFDADGKYLYKGLLTTNELKEYEDLKDTLLQEIPSLENELKQKYGDSVLNKYYLGKTLGCFLEEFQVSVKERRRFWDEIKNIATTETRIRADGKSKKRSFFEQCYKLSLINIDVVQNLSWRQWQSLLDRDDKIVEDTRLYDWIASVSVSVKELEWRELLKILNLYLDEIDTTVFSETEVINLYNSMLDMAKVWIEEIKGFEKKHPKSMKLDNKAKWSKKFYRECIDLLDEEMCLNHDALHDTFLMLMG